MKAASAALFGKEKPADLDAQTLSDAVAELPSASVAVGDLVVDAVVKLGFETGRGSARRTIAAGGLSLNNVKVTDGEGVLTAEDLLPGDVVLVRKGKTNLGVLKVS